MKRLAPIFVIFLAVLLLRAQTVMVGALVPGGVVYGWSMPPSSTSPYYSDYITNVMPQVSGNTLLLCVAGTASPNIGFDNGTTGPNFHHDLIDTYANLYSSKPMNFVISHIANGGINNCTSQYVATQNWADVSAPLWTAGTTYYGSLGYTVVCYPAAQCPSAGGTLSGSPFYILNSGFSGTCIAGGTSGPTADTGTCGGHWNAGAAHAPPQNFTFQPTGGGYKGNISFSGTVTANGTPTVTLNTGDQFNSGMDQIAFSNSGGTSCGSSAATISSQTGTTVTLTSNVSATCVNYVVNSGTYSIATPNCPKCTVATLVTGYPIVWESPYDNWWQQTVTLVINYLSTKQGTWTEGYIRPGIAVGGEAVLWNSSKARATLNPGSGSPGTAQAKGLFVSAAANNYAYIQAAVVAGNYSGGWMGAVNGGANSIQTCDWADALAAVVIANGGLVGSESLNEGDISGVPLGQCLTQNPPGSDNDAFWIFSQYPSSSAEMQQAGQSCPTSIAGSGSCSPSQTGGSIVKVLPFYLSQNPRAKKVVWEAFANDLLCTYDPAFIGNGSYTSQYSDCQLGKYPAAITAFKAGLGGTTKFSAGSTGSSTIK